MKRNFFNTGAVAAISGGVLMLACTATNCTAAEIKPPCCAEPAPAASSPTLPDKSLYQTESKWTTDGGKEIKLADLQGRPQVVVMFFASCQSACPILLNDLKRIESALSTEDRAGVGFTLVTIDPRRDTPEALANYRATRALPAATWTLLHGTGDDIRELAALLGVKYKEEATGQFSHSNIITVLNSQGEIAHQLNGLGQDIQPTVATLQKLIGKTSQEGGLAQK